MKRFGMVLIFSTTATAALAQTAPQPQQQPAGPPAPPAIQALGDTANRWLRDADIVNGSAQSLSAANNSLAVDSKDFVQKWQGLMSWAQSEAQQLATAQRELADAQSKYGQLTAILKQKGMDVEETNGKVAVIEGHTNWNGSPHGPQSRPQSPAPR